MKKLWLAFIMLGVESVTQAHLSRPETVQIFEQNFRLDKRKSASSLGSTKRFCASIGKIKIMSKSPFDPTGATIILKGGEQKIDIKKEMPDYKPLLFSYLLPAFAYLEKYWSSDDDKEHREKLRQIGLLIPSLHSIINGLVTFMKENELWGEKDDLKRKELLENVKKTSLLTVYNACLYLQLAYPWLTKNFPKFLYNYLAQLHDIGRCQESIRSEIDKKLSIEKTRKDFFAVRNYLLQEVGNVSPGSMHNYNHGKIFTALNALLGDLTVLFSPAEIALIKDEKKIDLPKIYDSHTWFPVLRSSLHNLVKIYPSDDLPLSFYHNMVKLHTALDPSLEKVKTS